MGSGTPGCRRAIRQRGPQLRPGLYRRTTRSRSWSWRHARSFGAVAHVRKRKRAARPRTTAGKPARNRRSAEQMLVELKQRLREISDLNAASDLLNWDQATYM